ncbi:hypothetical protein MOTT16_03980 [Moraxella osloensis]|uniref:Uncharacterized protein n=1 Tax=Faucicola osloensis TaxID=34062 RepID=A0AAD0ADZ5_FAUOS|nr:hypothetical protein [Moraxella osloensis]ATQ83053.1 hypothetical protein YHS_04005 [Moraxella osloensis]ATW85549.1 hypothetical protein MOTT16_03980 [Moraxella osloensis]
MNKEATIKSALTPFLKDADIRKAMEIFHKNYADITPYQIQRFVHEITQDNETKEYRSNIRRSLMKALSDYQMGAVNPQPMTHDIPNLGQNSPVTHPSLSQIAISNQKPDPVSSSISKSSQIAAFELLIDSFMAQFSPLLGSQILDSVKQTIHQHHNSSKSRGFGLLARRAETNQALTLTMIHFFDQFFGGDKQSALTMSLTDADTAGFRTILSLFYQQACQWAGPTDADMALAQANKITKAKFDVSLVEKFM